MVMEMDGLGKWMGQPEQMVVQHRASGSERARSISPDTYRLSPLCVSAKAPHGKLVCTHNATAGWGSMYSGFWGHHELNFPVR